VVDFAPLAPRCALVHYCLSLLDDVEVITIFTLYHNLNSQSHRHASAGEQSSQYTSLKFGLWRNNAFHAASSN
jgi:hypothetical protein